MRKGAGEGGGGGGGGGRREPVSDGNLLCLSKVQLNCLGFAFSSLSRGSYCSVIDPQQILGQTHPLETAVGHNQQQQQQQQRPPNSGCTDFRLLKTQVVNLGEATFVA